MTIQSGYSHNLPVEHDAKVASSKHPLQKFLAASLNLNIATWSLTAFSQFLTRAEPSMLQKKSSRVQLFLNLAT